VGRIRTANTRRWRAQGRTVVVMDVYERNGVRVEELKVVRNGWAQRHSPKQGRPAHWHPGDGDIWEWRPPQEAV